MAIKHVITTDRAPAPFQGAPYSQAIRLGDLVWISGQVGIDPETHEVADGVEAQTHQVMKNLQAIAEEAGSGLKQAVKTTIFLADFDDFQTVNEIYRTYMGPEPPARATVQVAYLPSGVLVEIDAIVHL
jgi:2-iminobutanoate/2-iminopropanoate deaminase